MRRPGNTENWLFRGIGAPGGGCKIKRRYVYHLHGTMTFARGGPYADTSER